MAMNTEGYQNVPRQYSNDFLVIEEADALDDIRQSLEDKLRELENLCNRIKKQDKKIATSVKFLEKFWCAFIAFNVLTLPTMLAMIFGILSYDPLNAPAQVISHRYLVSILVGLSMIFGLPFYMYTLNDLEDTIYKLHQCHRHTTDTATQTSVGLESGDAAKSETSRRDPDADADADAEFPDGLESEAFVSSLID